MTTATPSSAPIENPQPGAFSVIKNWAADLCVLFRFRPSETVAPDVGAAVDGNAWQTLTGPRLSAGGTSGRKHFAHKVIDAAQMAIDDGNGPVTFRTNDPRVKQIIRDIDPVNREHAIAPTETRSELVVRRRLQLDARETVGSEEKITRRALRRQIEDIEAALQMGEKIVVRLETPSLAKDKEVQQALRRLLKTKEYTSDGKLMIKVEGEQQDAVWQALGKGFISQKEKKAKQPPAPESGDVPPPLPSASRPAPTEQAQIVKAISAADIVLQERLRLIATEKAPEKVVLMINDLESFKYAEKHIRRMQRLYGAELLQVRVASGVVNREIQSFIAARNSTPDSSSGRDSTHAPTRSTGGRDSVAAKSPVGTDPRKPSRPVPLETEEAVAEFLASLADSGNPERRPTSGGVSKRKPAPAPKTDPDPEIEYV